MPLPFVGKTTTIRMDDNETQPDFEIPAMDTTIGTSPSGSAWRRNPIPACNCDLGEEGSCWGGGNKGYGGGNFTKAYEIDPQAPKKTPRCPTGVQFPPAWPEGCALPTPKPSAAVLCVALTRTTCFVADGFSTAYHAPETEAILAAGLDSQGVCRAVTKDQVSAATAGLGCDCRRL